MHSKPTLESRATGTTFASINRATLVDLDIPLPLRHEQENIALLLRDVLHKSAEEQALVDHTQELKRTAMATLFTRGLRGEAQKETDIGPVPESWTPVRCEAIFRLTSGKTRPNDLEPVQSTKKPYPVLGGNGVMGYSGSWNVNAPGIMIIGRVGEYCGAVHLASGKVWITDNALYAREWLLPNARLGFIGKFLEYYDLNRFKRMAGQPLVTQGMINEHSIPLPPPDEQDEIIAILDAIDRKIDLHKKKRAVLSELFKSMLHKLMTGEIRVADLDLTALNKNAVAA
jgi:type I restriction enzyme S subunit